MDRHFGVLELLEDHFHGAVIDEAANLPQRRKTDAKPAGYRGVRGGRAVAAKPSMNANALPSPADTSISRPAIRQKPTSITAKLVHSLGPNCDRSQRAAKAA